MIKLRPAGERGHVNHGWLDSWHSFSFAGYQDLDHVRWGPLRVINEDRVQPGTGVTHSEYNHEKEGITYFLQIWFHPAQRGLAAGRLAYAHVVRGEVVVNGHSLVAGDAVLYEDEPQVTIAGGRRAEVLVFDLPRMDA